MGIQSIRPGHAAHRHVLDIGTGFLTEYDRSESLAIDLLRTGTAIIAGPNQDVEYLPSSQQEVLKLSQVSLRGRLTEQRLAKSA